ncbi:hypothetical protein SSCG_05784 [Streptomyces clavuligerus]|nr:hypothetical protein SSCG_05784 [Streptomyces clavuligerus]
MPVGGGGGGVAHGMLLLRSVGIRRLYRYGVRIRITAQANARL